MSVVESGYLLSPIDKPAALRDQFAERVADLDLLGTLILAVEGLNWSIYGTPGALDDLRAFIEALALPGEVRRTRSKCDSIPFQKLKLRVRDELVTSGLDRALLGDQTGTHVAPEDFNALLDEPGVRLVDVRNGYEIGIGGFQGATNPGIDNFVEFPGFVEAQLASAEKDTPIALCCTGGIRCERASQYLLSRGFARVYQLSGGILAYLDSVPAEASRFKGECFVFDGRASLTSDLEPGNYQLDGPCVVRKR